MKDRANMVALGTKCALWLQKNHPGPAGYIYFLNNDKDKELWGSWSDGSCDDPVGYSQFIELIERAIELGIKITVDDDVPDRY